MTTPAAKRPLETAFEKDRAFLWAFTYRMTGDPSDADDVVQDAFVRAMEAAPSEDRSLRPWLTRVAANLAIDRLRQRQQRAYPGVWLPAAIAEEELAAEPGSDHRYELKESATIAFLVALEALTPSQRAVLLLRDVFELSVEETAKALDLSAANVKTTLHRARVAMESYDLERIPLTEETIAKHQAVLERFLAALVEGDVNA